MANWKYSINIRDAWRKAQDDEITNKELADEIVKALLKLHCHDEELLGIIDEFNDLDEESDNDDFNPIMEALYDWGDTEIPPYSQWLPNKMCWIGVI